jgi:hypothetical protein
MDFCKKNPNIKLSFDEWKSRVYGFNESFRDYILETGERAKLPAGFGEFTVNKKKSTKLVTLPDGRKFINLPIDWKKTKEVGKRIYQFNYHTEGYKYKWDWFKDTARLKQTQLWYFKPTRVTSRLLAHYLKTDNKYQHLYCQWTFK